MLRSEINAIFFRCFRKNVVFCSGFFFILPYPSLFFSDLPFADRSLGAVKTDFAIFLHALRFALLSYKENLN